MTMVSGNNFQNAQNILRSGPSEKHSYVRFLNRTQRRVDVFWINYDGARVRYKTLGPYEFLDVNTYANHPWIFRDTDTADRMVVSCKGVFNPEPWDAGVPLDGPRYPQRKLVCITLPVYSLKERCFQVVRHRLPSKAHVYELDMPISLQHDFYRFLNRQT